MHNAGQDWAAATGYRSLTEALTATEAGKGEPLGRKAPQRDAHRPADPALDRVLALARCFEQLRAGPAARLHPPPGRNWTQPLLPQRTAGALNLGCLPVRIGAGPGQGGRHGGRDASLPRVIRERPPVKTSRQIPLASRHLAGPLGAFIAAFVIALPAVGFALDVVSPSVPYPDWGMKALGDLTFGGAADAGEASMLVRAPVLARGDRLDAAAQPRLAVANYIEAKVDEAVPFPIAVEAIEGIGQGSALVVRGLPEDAGLSHGEGLEPGSWRLDPRSAPDLTLTLYRRLNSPQAISIELVAPNGEVVAAASTTLTADPAEPRV
jgi:hypothetical protein